MYKLCIILFIFVLAFERSVIAQHHRIEPDTFLVSAKKPLTAKIIFADSIKEQTKFGIDKAVINKLTLHKKKDSLNLENRSVYESFTIPGKHTEDQMLLAATIQLSPVEVVPAMIEEKLNKEEKKLLKELNITDLNAGIMAQRVHFAKTLLSKGSPSKDEVFKKFLNEDLEILLLTNPIAMKPGNFLSFQLIHHTKVLTNKEVLIYHKNPKGQSKVIKTKTSNTGIAQIQIQHPGKYLVVAEQIGPYFIKSSEEIIWEALKASYYLEVKF